MNVRFFPGIEYLAWIYSGASAALMEINKYGYSHPSRFCWLGLEQNSYLLSREALAKLSRRDATWFILFFPFIRGVREKGKAVGGRAPAMLQEVLLIFMPSLSRSAPSSTRRSSTFVSKSVYSAFVCTEFCKRSTILDGQRETRMFLEWVRASGAAIGDALIYGFGEYK